MSIFFTMVVSLLYKYERRENALIFCTKYTNKVGYITGKIGKLRKQTVNMIRNVGNFVLDADTDISELGDLYFFIKDKVLVKREFLVKYKILLFWRLPKLFLCQCLLYD